VKGVYDGLNGKKSKSLETAEKFNESASHRAIGLTIETRPDVCTREHIDEMLSYGATRVELGVQHPDDKIYKLVNRGHFVSHVVEATKDLKDSAFKIVYHIMPGLPGSNKKKDIAMVKQLFSDPRFQPDMLKIYPTLVMPNTKLHEMMVAGKFTPYTTEEAADVISEFYRYIPSYVRVMRVQRDIPVGNISEGVKKSNLREMVEKEIKNKKIIPAEIRIREVGLQNKKTDNLHLTRIDYEASGGKEIFLSYETADNYIAGFVRLRIPSESFREEIDGETALIRELHVYGKEIELGASGAVQHKGIGKKLLEEAERIAKEEFNRTNMIVISGVGVREYYYKLGYSPCGAYVGKKLK
jgi:elongator complex protein 3